MLLTSALARNACLQPQHLPTSHLLEPKAKVNDMNGKIAVDLVRDVDKRGSECAIEEGVADMLFQSYLPRQRGLN